jgi:hypothetical protein
VKAATAAVRTISAAAVTSAIRAGRAEVLGNQLGDPVYLGGAFWQMAEDGYSYELIDSAKAVVCAGALLRLRAARATRASAG